MCGIVRAFSIVGLVSAFCATSAMGGGLDSEPPRESVAANAPRLVPAPSLVTPASSAAAQGDATASDRCGAPRAFEQRAMSSHAARAKARFALDVLARLASKSTNVTISPFGLSAVLSTLDLGGDPAMKKAISSTLRVGPRGIEALRRESRLVGRASARDPRRFTSYNGIFADHRLTLKPGVAELAKAEGEVDLEAVDFDSQKSIDSVNELLAKNTGGRIKTILELGSAPLLVVANAFAFKDCWKTQFDKSKTEGRPFTRVDGSKAEVSTMSLVSDTIAWRASGRFVAVELPYRDEDFALTLVTTQKEPARLADFRGAIPLMAGIDFAEARVTLSLPKFGRATDNELLELLSGMGLKPGLASTNQLPGFADGLVLGRVRQKTWLSVDEIGTEAATMTVAEAMRSVVEPKTVTVRFDKPFVYALRYRPTGTILMAGYVGDPVAERK